MSITAFAAQALPNKGLSIGGTTDTSACAGMAQLKEDSTVDLKDKKITISTPVKKGDIVLICESNNDYLGVVIQSSTVDCGVSRPLKSKKNYKGPCKYGWLKRTQISLLGGQ